MKPKFIILIIVVIILAIIALLRFSTPEDSWVCQNGQWQSHGHPESPAPATGCEQPLVGNDRDEHGCIGSAGYSWCDPKNKCLRIWEEPCQ